MLLLVVARRRRWIGTCRVHAFALRKSNGGTATHSTARLFYLTRSKTKHLLVTTTCTVVGAGSHSLGDKIRTPTRPPVLSCPVLSRPSETRPFSVSKQKKPSRSSVSSCTVKREERARLTTCAGPTDYRGEREGMQQQYVVVRTIGVCLPLQRSQGILPLCVPCCND